MWPRGQISPSETRESGLPAILTALPFTTLTLVAQRVEQLRQEVVIHSSVITPSALSSEGVAGLISGYLIIRLATSAAPVRADTLRKVLLSRLKRSSFSLFGPPVWFLFTGDLPFRQLKAMKNSQITKIIL